MRKAEIYMHGQKAGFLTELKKNNQYQFVYNPDYEGLPISVAMPIEMQGFEYDRFPPFFEGLLPEGVNLEMLLRTKKIDRNDVFTQLMAVGGDTVGAVTVREVRP
jgi:serine/threonine-protein kinase HipA